MARLMVLPGSEWTAAREGRAGEGEDGGGVEGGGRAGPRLELTGVCVHPKEVQGLEGFGHEQHGFLFQHLGGIPLPWGLVCVCVLCVV